MLDGVQRNGVNQVTQRDLVNAIPLYAIKQGLLTVEKAGKKNIFSGRILEIEAGVTNNEPAQLSVKEAIESAVVHLIVQGNRSYCQAAGNPFW
ncbi:bifunctional aconitate hydratase 2/2-methylisocitrate dehydratase [Alcaligenes faecalis subsp. faecalis NCIB 8687]|nr:bifunctional aconitate hydratase 2/2-methylisocitrate dehydratase [Alcaligenes faecalis subsp. faecalis NCIB 8687]